MENKELCNVEPGFVFKFYKFGTRELLPTKNLRLNGNCGYVELGGAFESIELLDKKVINKNDEVVRVYGKFKDVFKTK